MVFFHGGGLVAGNLDTDEPQCKTYVAQVPCVVVSIEYPLAPTYKFERIKEACIEAVSWVCFVMVLLQTSTDEYRPNTMPPDGMLDLTEPCCAAVLQVPCLPALLVTISTAL